MTDANTRGPRPFIYCAAILAAVLLSSCAGVVYKDSAASFTAAGELAAKRVRDSADALDESRDRSLRQKIATEPTCPVADARLFVRNQSSAAEVVASAMKRFPVEGESEGCGDLYRCEAGNQQDCSDICYSSNEALCIINLEWNYSKQAAELAKDRILDADQMFKDEMRSYLQFVNNTEYKRTGSVESLLVSDSLKSISQYIGLLVKLSEERESGIAEDAEQIASALETSISNLESLTGKQLSASSSANLEKLNTSINALGKFAKVVQEISNNHADAQEIKRLVTENSVNVEELIGALRDISKGDTYLSIVFNNMANIEAREQLQQKFRSADQAERVQILERLESFPLEEAPAENELDEVFAAAIKAHSSLVSLVNDPTDAQKKKISAERLSNFKSVALSFANVLKIFL